MRILKEIDSIAHSPLFFMSYEQSRALERMHTCRTMDCGGRLLKCPNCATRAIVYNPCNQRGCPECAKRNQMLWKQKVEQKLLPVSHYHLVFSIPRAYTDTWLRNKRAVIQALFKSVSSVLAQTISEQNVLAGSVLVFQSHGKGMCYKPHMHCILSAGGLTDNKVWQEIGSLPYNIMAEQFSTLMSKELGKKILPECLPDTQLIRHTEWTIHPEYHHTSGNNIVGYLSHTACGSVINLKQDFKITTNTISFTETHNGKSIETELDKNTFVSRYFNHIPPDGVVCVRYYGLYSNKRKEDVEEARKQFPAEVEKKDDESVIDLCPKCNARMSTMVIFPPRTDLGYLNAYIDTGPPIKGLYHIL
jgi:hypothetical protein